MISNRQLKVGEMIKRSLSVILSRDIYIESLADTYISLSKVMMTSDLGIADVYIFPVLSDKISSEYALDSLNKMSPKIRHILAQKIVIKKLPMLRFKLDNSMAEVARIESLLKR